MARSKSQLLPGIDGVPFRLPAGEQVPNLKQTDVRQPVEVWDAHVKVFYLNSREDLKDYTTVVDQIAKGTCLLSAEDRQWDDSKKTFVIFLRWLSRYLEMPNGRTTENGQSTSFR